MKVLVGEFQKMRLYNTYFLCKQCRAKINGLKFNDTNKSSVYRIANWNEYKNTLLIIREVPILKTCVDSFYNTVPTFVRENEAPEIDSGTRNTLNAKKTELVQIMDTVIALYESMGLENGKEGIDVKIPPCDSLDQYISYLKEIDFVFTQCPFLQHKDGLIKFKAVDVGSQWLSFLVESSVGAAAITYILSNLAFIVDKAVQVKSHINNLKQQEEIIRSQKLQNEVVKSTIEGFEFLRKHYLSEAVKEIESESSENALNDGEERGKAEKSLEKLCILLDKGVEIYASIDTEHKIQEMFPTMGEKIKLPDDILKYLEDKKDE